MRLTKALLASAVAATLASQAVAGGFAPVVVDAAPVEPVVVVEPEAPRSTFGILLPLALLGGLVALAVASDDESEDE
ncbi:hypothetical protein FHG66_09715 [Rubellimicrobium rubrum]|uniref:Ferrochelatase n=1 Tax=Rubellimicrobium rubrum TaxID=2585369 RepID=A0A5C4MW47_9RHOB|nr:hypothetical protein [Rubellimicrobium rubrum]TNC49786.1 hypothetical protein FHG66_09715 [Rubellimicrobium rubrum]